jgi:prepilin-type N-terminal cleavage/methylation domain-containing protein
MIRKKYKGFTLVELAVVIVIIGVLAAFGVPQFLKSVERSKAAEAFNYLSAIRSAQERYLAKQGLYADETNKGSLDITQTPPKYFDVGSIHMANTAAAPTWDLTLSRKSSTSSYGTYTVQFTQNGFNTDSSASSIMNYTDINPIGS